MVVWFYGVGVDLTISDQTDFYVLGFVHTLFLPLLFFINFVFVSGTRCRCAIVLVSRTQCYSLSFNIRTILFQLNFFFSLFSWKNWCHLHWLSLAPEWMSISFYLCHLHRILCCNLFESFVGIIYLKQKKFFFVFAFYFNNWLIFDWSFTNKFGNSARNNKTKILITEFFYIFFLSYFELELFGRFYVIGSKIILSTLLCGLHVYIYV